jgi:hypothetical protein
MNPVCLSLEGHDSQVVSAAFSLDGKRIVTASWTRAAVRRRSRKTAKPGTLLLPREPDAIARKFLEIGIGLKPIAVH